MDKKQELAIKKEVKELSLDDFIGNFEQVEKITNWLSDFHSGNTEIKYVSIVGDSGNGKTYLAQILAEVYGIELMRIDPWIIESGKDLNSFMKSINLDPLDLKRKKIILIDCIDEFHHRYRKGLLEIRDFSIYPVIYTSIKPISTLKNRQDGLFIKLERPSTGELYTLLKKHNRDNISDEIIRKIAEGSPSVRSAINSLKSESVNHLIERYPDRYEILRSIQARELEVPLTRKNIYWIFHSIRGVKNGGTILDLYAVAQKFCDFEHRIIFYHETYDAKMTKEGIDPMFVNFMEEPLEKVRFELQLKKTRDTKKAGKKKTKVEKPESTGEWGI